VEKEKFRNCLHTLVGYPNGKADCEKLLAFSKKARQSIGGLNIRDGIGKEMSQEERLIFFETGVACVTLGSIIRESLRPGTPSRWTVGDRVVVELNGGLYVGEIGTLDSGSSEGGFVWFGDKSNCRSQHFEPSKKESTFPMEFVGEAGGLNGQVRVILATVEPKSDGLWYHGSMGSNFQLPSKVVAMGAMMSSFSKEDSEWKHVPVRSFLNKKEVLLGLIGLHKGELVRNECCEEFSIESCDVKLDTYSCEEVVLSRGQVHRKVPDTGEALVCMGPCKVSADMWQPGAVEDVDDKKGVLFCGDVDGCMIWIERKRTRNEVFAVNERVERKTVCEESNVWSSVRIEKRHGLEYDVLEDDMLNVVQNVKHEELRSVAFEKGDQVECLDCASGSGVVWMEGVTTFVDADNQEAHVELVGSSDTGSTSKVWEWDNMRKKYKRGNTTNLLNPGKWKKVKTTEDVMVSKAETNEGRVMRNVEHAEGHKAWSQLPHGGFRSEVAVLNPSVE
jgi:hypothetical protein